MACVHRSLRYRHLLEIKSHYMVIAKAAMVSILSLPFVTLEWRLALLAQIAQLEVLTIELRELLRKNI